MDVSLSLSHSLLLLFSFSFPHPNPLSIFLLPLFHQDLSSGGGNSFLVAASTSISTYNKSAYYTHCTKEWMFLSLSFSLFPLFSFSHPTLFPSPYSFLSVKTLGTCKIFSLENTTIVELKYCRKGHKFQPNKLHVSTRQQEYVPLKHYQNMLFYILLSNATPSGHGTLYRNCHIPNSFEV